MLRKPSALPLGASNGALKHLEKERSLHRGLSLLPVQNRHPRFGTLSSK